MKQLFYNARQRTLLVPEGWEELTAKQFIAIAGILHSNESASMKYDRALQAVCNKSLFSFLRIPAEIRLRCYEHITWIFEKQDITKQLVPVYKGLYGPESEFNNLVLAEFHHTEMAYFNLTQHDEEAALDELVAILYREPKKNYNIKRDSDGDVRVPFKYGDIRFHQSIVERWPDNVKLAVLLWYDSCRQQLVKDYPSAFEGVAAAENYYQGLYPMIRSLSGDKYGEFDKVELLGVHTAFMEIVESKKEEAELERKYNIT